MTNPSEKPKTHEQPEPSEHGFTHMTMIGLGLIGGSFTMGVRAAYPDLQIRAMDVREEALQYGLKHGIIDRASRVLPTAYEGRHLVVLGCHLNASLEYLSLLAPLVKGQDVVVMDLGSCKRGITDLGAEVLPDQFIGGHPMAGKETTGVEHATALLNAGKLFFLTPTERMKGSETLTRLEAFITGMGARPTVIDPALHDQSVAYVSHLPQLYATLLTNLIGKHGPAELLSYHGGGIDDQLRLAASPHAMWGDVFAHNQDNLRTVLRELIALMQEADAALDQPEMKDWFTRSNDMYRLYQKQLANQWHAPTPVKVLGVRDEG